MDKIMLYRSDDQVSIPGLAYQQKIYRDKDRKCYIVLNDDNKNPYVAYPLLGSSSFEHINKPYDEGGYVLGGDRVALGRCMYHSNSFEISKMSWDDFQDGQIHGSLLPS